MGKKLIVLDLDNTCICAKEPHEIKNVVSPQFYKGKNKFYDLF